MHPLQQKFQIRARGKVESGDSWVGQDSQRDVLGLTKWSSENPVGCDDQKFNYTPPGMEIDNQKRTQVETKTLVLSGESDVSKTDPSNWNTGFTPLQMRSADGQHDGNGMDLFYGDADGFIERNNYLDRA